MLKKVYDSPEMEITRISFQAIMEEQENQMNTSVAEGGAHGGDPGLGE